jgi:hypothetical protein
MPGAVYCGSPLSRPALTVSALQQVLRSSAHMPSDKQFRFLYLGLTLHEGTACRTHHDTEPTDVDTVFS